MNAFIFFKVCWNFSQRSTYSTSYAPHINTPPFWLPNRLAKKNWKKTSCSLSLLQFVALPSCCRSLSWTMLQTRLVRTSLGTFRYRMSLRSSRYTWSGSGPKILGGKLIKRGQHQVSFQRHDLINFAFSLSSVYATSSDAPSASSNTSLCCRSPLGRSAFKLCCSGAFDRVRHTPCRPLCRIARSQRWLSNPIELLWEERGNLI